MSTPGVAAEVLALLRARGETVATAESLTGGMVSARLTDVPGSSDVVRGGVVSYATEVKVEVLGVPQQVVDGPGVVSRACAEAMAAGARCVLGADWGLATTGVAGPGPADGHPAGSVHVAVAGPPGADGESPGGHRLLHCEGSRAQVREATVEAVLALLRQALGEPVSVALGTVGEDASDHDRDDEREPAKEG